MPAARQHLTAALLSLALVAALAMAGNAGGVRIAPTPDRVAPTAPVSLNVVAATRTTASLVWTPSVDNVAVAYYLVRIDTESTPVRETMFVAEDLECGESVDVEVVAYDAAGNSSPGVVTTVASAACLDNRAPTPPSGFRQVATARDKVVLEWTKPSDDEGVVGYGVYRNELLVEYTPETAIALAGLRCGRTFAYEVDAVDAAGNRSARGAAWLRTDPCTASAGRSTQPTGSANGSGAPGRLAPASTSNRMSATSGCPSGQYQAHYFSNRALDGTPDFIRCESTIDHSWGSGGPGSPIPTDDFSARWVGDFDFPAGDTTFTATADDGIRLYVDGELQIDKWIDQSPTTYTITRTLTAGTHQVKVEYYERGGGATVKLSWASSSPPPPPPPSGCPAGQYQATYFANITHGGTPSLTRCESTLSNSWGSGGPGSPVPTDNFSARWVGDFDFPAGDTTFTVTADDGVRLSVDGQLVLDRWIDQSPTTYTITRTLTAGTHQVKVGYYERGGGATVKLSWASSSSPPPPPPPPPPPDPDGQGPTPPTNVTATSRTATSIALAWSPSSDDVGVEGYGLYRNGTYVGSTSTTTAIFTGLTCNTNYTLAVDAYDDGGHRSAKTTLMVATTACPDATPPSTPTGLVATNIGQTSLTLTWNASTDNVGVTGYDVYRAGVKMASVTSTSSLQSGLVCGTSYWHGVEALDAAGNRSPRVSVLATTSACPPPPPPPSGRLWAPDSPINTKVPTNAQVLLGYGQGVLSGLPGIGFNGGAWGVALFRGDYSGRPRITVTNWNGNPSSPKWYIDNVPVPAQFTAYWDRMQAAGDTEKNAFIFDGDRGYHIYASTRDMTQIQAGSVLRSNGSGFNDNRVSPWTRASGFSSATGLVLKSELDAGRVDHALACAWPKNRISGPSWTTANTFLDPATSSDGSAGTGGAKMGSRIQLNPSLTEAQLRSFGVSDYYLPLARAMQEYGCYIVESSSWMTIYAESHNDSGPVNWPSGWHPGSAQLVPHLRIVAPPPAPVYDTHHVFGQPHR